MLYRENEEYKLMPYVAKYEQHGAEHEQHVVGKEEMESFEEMGHITNLSFEEVAYPDGQLERLEEVKRYPESELQAVSAYVLDDVVLEGSAVHRKKQQDTLEQSILEMTLLMNGGMVE